MRCAACGGNIIKDDWDGELRCLLCTRTAGGERSVSLHALSASLPDGPKEKALAMRRGGEM